MLKALDNPQGALPDSSIPTPSACQEQGPLSFSQEGFWFLDQFGGADRAYVVITATRIAGKLDADRLEASLRALVARHAALRTLFLDSPEGVRQCVLPPQEGASKMAWLRVQADPAERDGDALAQRLEQLLGQPFDLARELPLRAACLALGDGEHVLALSAHHLVADGASMVIVYRDLAAIYAAGADASGLPQAQRATSLLAHARRQRQLAADGAWDAQRAYWREALAGVQDLRLPIDMPRPDRSDFIAGTVRSEIPRTLVDALHATGAAHGATHFRSYLALFQALLARVGANCDFAVGIPVAGRRDPALRDSVGNFINTLAIRMPEDALGGSFAQLLRASATRVAKALQHSDYPFELVVADLAPGRSAQRNPIYQAYFALNNVPEQWQVSLPGLDCVRVPMVQPRVTLDLLLGVEEHDRGATATWQYRADLYSHASIERLARQYVVLLEGLLADPSRALQEVALLEASERKQVLEHFASGGPAMEPFVAMHDAVRAQARSTPDAVALRWRSHDMSYLELDDRAERWAALLRRGGAGAETLVALCMPRSFAEVVALLAILKSGAAFVPLDPDNPQERLRGILEDAQPVFVLTQQALLDRLQRVAPTGTLVLAMPEDGSGGDVGPLAQSDRATRPGDLAYAIFTSGTTGSPKGTLLEHRGLSNHIEWIRRALDAGAGDAFLQNVSLAFDGSLYSFFAPLCCGARIVLADSEQQKDMRQLHRLMLDEGVTTAMLVPSVLRALLDQTAPGDVASLRYLGCGGEALDSALVRRVFATWPGVRLGNLYGPTEATVVCVAAEVRAQDLQGPTAPIGRPTAGMRAYVLDAAMQPQPVGAIGELYIGGIGVARGYLKRPELSAERFMADPFRPGGRVYRSGDLARWRADGMLEYLGRADHQVKLRGLRVELGEIEASLLAVEGVGGAVVMVRGDAPRTQRLVAFVASSRRDAQALREQLGRSLPSYMVPTRVVFLDELPTLSSAKVDRRALEALDVADEQDQEFMPQAPRSALEASLLEIWQGVLGNARIDMSDDFFALGGNSLQATQVVSQIRAALGIDLELRLLFDKPTLRELSQEIDSRLEAGARREAPEPIATIPRDGPLPLSFSQRRMWLEHQMDPQGAAYNVFSAIRLRGALDRDALQHTLDALCARHEAFRTRFGFEAGEPVARLGPVEPAVLECIDVAHADAAARGAIQSELVARAARPFDLERGALYRFVLARVADDEHLLVVVMHHIITDGWSGGVLLGELTSLYNAARLGRPTQLPAQAIEFADFAAWQREHVNDASLQPQIAYWLERLDGMVPLSLPSDSGRSARSSSLGDLVLIPLSDAWIENLQRQSARLDCTPFMVLFAVFQSMLARWCGQDDVAVGFPIANRTRVEAEGVVGSLVNTLVMRNHVDLETTFRKFLQGELRPAVLGAFTHQDLPYDNLLNRLRERAGAGDDPGIRVLFNVLNSPRPPLRLEGLEADYVDIGLGSTQFDLSLGVDPVSQKALGLSYSTELFDRSTIQRLGELFLHGLARALGDPDTQLLDLWAAPDSDLQLLRNWNSPPSTPVPELPPDVAALLAASRTRSGPAIREAGGRTLNYPELWQAVDRLRDVLMQRGAGRGKLIGLGLPRGADMVVAQLAVLHCGAAYVPLDPQFPAARLRDMIDDAGLLLLVTTTAQADVWAGSAVPLLELDAAPAHKSGVPGEAAAWSGQPARPDDPAYVIYTSGSTGKPKGVIVQQRGVVNFLLSMQRQPGLRADDVLLAVTTLSFDIAVLELLLPLVVGACVAIASHEETADGGALLRRLQHEGATVMQATPATWRMLIDAGWRGAAGFRALVGGEALGRELADELLSRSSELWNMYGPTETTVWSTCWRVLPAPAPIRIGGPIANTQVHVLDPRGRPCPIGFSGEMYIGGEGVSAGYLHRPELSAERFLPDLFSGVGGARMYRTGDRGRWGHDGLLEHQGRTDFQVKLRGFRIELGEIESHLRAHADVAQSLAMVREDIPGDPRLVAYVVPRAPGLEPVQLRDWLRARLPGYMVPQQMVMLADFPRLPNGKTNRAALPRPSQEAVTSARDGADAPSTPAEQVLAALWSRLLGSSEVRRSDNFFDLGGHSLLANRVVVEFEKSCGTRLNLRRMVHESLAQLAAGIDLAESQGPVAAEAPRARPAGVWSVLRERLGL